MNESTERFLHGAMLVLNENASAQEAARAMYERHVGSVVVANDDGKMVGLVTDRDLASQVLAFGYPLDAPIHEFMTTELYTITENQPVSDAIKLMATHGIRRVPVIRRLESGKERCVGMISLDDLISEKAIDIEMLSSIVSKQVLRPQAARRNREERNQERLEHKLNRFYSILEKHTLLDRIDVEELSHYVLSSIVRRLPSSGAAQLISQLPRLLQEDLLDLKAGPNRHITADALVSGVASKFNFTPGNAKKVLHEFWEALEEFTADSNEPNQALMQLPVEMRELLT